MSVVETLPAPETQTWCESGTVGDGTVNNPGDIDPDGGDVAHGWPETDEPPPRQRWNYILQLVHKITRLWRQRSIAPYHADETYPPGARVTYGDGVVSYQRIDTGNTKGTAPTDNTKWMRWGHTTEQLEEAVDAHLGTYSGALAGGTVTPAGDSTVDYCRAQRFPNSTEKVVCFRLSLDKGQGGWADTIVLSGAAAFDAGADGVLATIASLGGNTGVPSLVLGSVVNETTVAVSVSGGTLDGTNNLTLDVWVRGH